MILYVMSNNMTCSSIDVQITCWSAWCNWEWGMLGNVTKWPRDLLVGWLSGWVGQSSVEFIGSRWANSTQQISGTTADKVSDCRLPAIIHWRTVKNRLKKKKEKEEKKKRAENNPSIKDIAAAAVLVSSRSSSKDVPVWRLPMWEFPNSCAYVFDGRDTIQYEYKW